MEHASETPAPTAVSADWGLWEVLIAVTSISVASFALLISFFGVVFYFLGREWAEERIAHEVREQIKASDLEIRGRLVGYVGFIFGRLHEVRPDFIESAIKYSQSACSVFPDGSELKLAAMNNLAFYYSVRGYSTDGPTAKQYAVILLDNYATSQNINHLNTYASVVGAYHHFFENPDRALKDAEKMMEEIQRRKDVTLEQKQSAARHLAKIRAALKQIAQPKPRSRRRP